MRRGFEQKEENFRSSDNHRLADVNNSLNYFNSNFGGNSESSRDGIELGSVHEQPNSPGCPSSSEYQPIIKPSDKFFSNQSAGGTMPLQTPFKEKSLAEIGFNSTEIPNWERIVQPHKTDLLVLLEKMIKNYEKTNVQIRINETTFNCHMMVLQCYSDFFMELNNEQLVVLPADKVTPQAFVMVYDWMLSSKPMVQREGILELFNAAQFLKIKGLVDQCWVCLDDDERFCEDAAFLLYLEARTFGHELIQQLMLTRICKFFLTLVASKEFLELTPKEICTLLQSNSIGVNTETEVLMAAVRWLSFDWAEREQHMLEVMACVRFGLMTPWQLVELRRNTDSPEILRVVESPAIQKMIDDGLSYVTTKYWYASNTENLFHFMERLNLTEPVERQWIRDKMWSEHFECPNQMYTSYNSFLDYLEMIRSMGKDHWKTLECHEGIPNLVFQGYIPNANNNFSSGLTHDDQNFNVSSKIGENSSFHRTSGKQ